MTPIRHICAAGPNLYALANDGSVWRRRGENEWVKLPGLPDITDKRQIVERQKAEPHLLSKRGIIGRTFFTGKVWTQHIEDAQRYNEGAAVREAELIPGTEAIAVSLAVEEQQRLLGPRRQPRKRKRK